MALKDLIKKKGETTKQETSEKPRATDKEERRELRETPKAKSLGGIAPRILLAPHVTEKAGNLGAMNQYVFKVASVATKIDVARAVYEVYGIRPVNVHTVNMPRKLRRRGQAKGFKSGVRKAIVTLPKGKTIEVLPR